MSDLMDYAEECLSKPCELHSEHEKALYALRDCVTEMSRLMAALKDSRAEIERLAAVGEPVGMKMTQEMFHKTDGKAGAFLWWKDVPYGAKLYTAPPSVDALIAEIDELCFDEASGGYFWPESIHPSVIKEILDKYRSAK